MDENTLKVLRDIASRDPRYARFVTGTAETAPVTSEVKKAGLVRCGSCRKGTRIKVHEDMPVEMLVKLLSSTTPDESWPVGWEKWEVTAQARTIMASAQ